MTLFPFAVAVSQIACVSLEEGDFQEPALFLRSKSWFAKLPFFGGCNLQIPFYHDWHGLLHTAESNWCKALSPLLLLRFYNDTLAPKPGDICNAKTHVLNFYNFSCD